MVHVCWISLLHNLVLYFSAMNLTRRCPESTAVLVELLWGSFHCKDLEFSLFNAEFYALLDGVIFKIDILHFLRYALLF